jgi:sugar phosphate isomerase/epimerase
MPLPGGENAMELLLEHAPSIEWEMDVAWVVRGGADPLAWITRYKDQITTAHVKDIAAEGTCADEDGWADVGHGTVDWKAIMVALRDIDVDLFVMEHDNPNDMMRFAKRSIDTIRKL